MNMKQFSILNYVFSLYQNIDEIYELLLNLINDNKYSITFNNNLFILVIQFPMPGGKIIKIDFNLLEYIIRPEELINKLNLTVHNLINENNKIKNELQKKDKEILSLKNKYIQLEKRLQNIEDYLKKKENNSFELNSKIIENNEEKNNLIKWISSKGAIKKIKLLYRGTEDGDSSKIFFQKCKNKGPTLSLIKTKNGKKFGGFTKMEWTDEKKNIILGDNDAFLFSLNNMEKYNILKSQYAIACFPYYDLVVYGNNKDGYGIYICDKFLSVNSVENHKSRVYDVPSNYCLSGENLFNIVELEVYQIIFE